MLPLMPRNQKNKKWVKETEQIFKKFQESKWLICFIYWRIFRDWRWVIVYITLLQQADQFFAPRGALWKLFVVVGVTCIVLHFLRELVISQLYFFIPVWVPCERSIPKIVTFSKSLKNHHNICLRHLKLKHDVKLKI